jgi:hypothetical protein
MTSAGSKTHALEDATAAALYLISMALLFGLRCLPPDVQLRPGVRLARDAAESMLTAYVRSGGSVDPEQVMQMLRVILDHLEEADLCISDIFENDYDGE